MLHAGEGQHSLPVKQLETGASGDVVPCGHTAQITQVGIAGWSPANNIATSPGG